jgi:hypothetical protein
MNVSLLENLHRINVSRSPRVLHMDIAERPYRCCVLRTVGALARAKDLLWLLIIARKDILLAFGSSWGARGPTSGGVSTFLEQVAPSAR